MKVENGILNGMIWNHHDMRIPFHGVSTPTGKGRWSPSQLNSLQSSPAAPSSSSVIMQSYSSIFFTVHLFQPKSFPRRNRNCCTCGDISDPSVRISKPSGVKGWKLSALDGLQSYISRECPALLLGSVKRGPSKTFVMRQSSPLQRCLFLTHDHQSPSFRSFF